MEVYYQNGHLYCFCENGENIGGRWGTRWCSSGFLGRTSGPALPCSPNKPSSSLNYSALDGTIPVEASIVDSWVPPQRCAAPSSSWSPETKTSFLCCEASTKLMVALHSYLGYSDVFDHDRGFGRPKVQN